MRNPGLSACTRYTHLYQGSDPDKSLLPAEFARSLSVLSMSCWTHLYPDKTDCDRMQQSVIRIVNCWISEQFSRLRKSSRVRVHQHASSFTLLYYIFWGSGAGVTINGMSGTEGQDPGGTDPIDLQLPRGATGNSREQSTPQSTVPVTPLIDTESLLQMTPYQRDNDHVFFSCFPLFFSFFVPLLQFLFFSSPCSSLFF